MHPKVLAVGAAIATRTGPCRATAQVGNEDYADA
jgi:hypothetical protein